MSDMISREAAMAEIEFYRRDWAYASDAIRALPAVHNLTPTIGQLRLAYEAAKLADIDVPTAMHTTLSMDMQPADPMTDPRVVALMEAAKDAHDALISAKEFISRKYGSINPARETAILSLQTALRQIGGAE